MKKAIFAGGCFWGVEYYMNKCAGVVSVISGYTGGETENPTYPEVKSGTTGHAEAVEITYDENITDFETLLKMFMEIHNPEQLNGQGYDLGTQYRSEVYYANEEEHQTIIKIIDTLKENGLNVVTKVSPVSKFYVAEDYHQEYYDIKGTLPDCHSRVKRF